MLSSAISQRSNFLLLAGLLACCLYTALASLVAVVPLAGEYSRILLGAAHYVGFGAAVSCLLSYICLRRFFRSVLGITLLLALFNLAAFLPTSTTIGLAFGSLRVGLNPFALLLLVGYYFSNRAAANAFIRKNLLPAPTPQQVARQRREAINQFKQTFARRTDTELRQLVQERKLVTDAVAAARELLAERGQLPQP